MFKIKDGREYFYQWDLDRQLIVEDATVKEVHFTNRATNDAYVCETYVEDSLTLVNVPNILLQANWRIQAYAYDGKHTKHDVCYEVKARSKPSDYVYTETEVVRFEDLEARMEALENKEATSSHETVGMWQPNTQYFAGDTVLYVEDIGDWETYGYMHCCTEDHVSGEEFELDYWSSNVTVNNLYAYYADSASYAYSAEEAYYAEEAGSVSYAANADWAEWAETAGSANYATFDDMGNDISTTYIKRVYIPDEENDGFDNTENDITINLNSLDNEEYRYIENMLYINFIVPNGSYSNDFMGALSFKTGSIRAPQISYTNSGIIQWVGTDCSVNNGLSIFAPQLEMQYDLVFYFNGTYFVGLVNGYKVATGNA